MMMKKQRKIILFSVFCLTGVMVCLAQDKSKLPADIVERFNLVWVPGGEFVMGADTGDPDEKPEHKVQLSGFWMGRTEVTVRQWREFVKTTGYEWNKWDELKKHAPGDDYPAVFISWKDAREYCRWVSEKYKCRMDLPTEAQWEYAAKAGRSFEYATADGKINHNTANYFGCANADKYEFCAPVKSFPPNPFGLHEMSGNVWEWCRDNKDVEHGKESWFYRESADKTDMFCGEQYKDRAVRQKILRGGSFAGDYCYGLKTTARYGAPEYARGFDFGLRYIVEQQR